MGCAGTVSVRPSILSRTANGYGTPSQVLYVVLHLFEALHVDATLTVVIVQVDPVLGELEMTDLGSEQKSGEIVFPVFRPLHVLDELHVAEADGAARDALDEEQSAEQTAV